MYRPLLHCALASLLLASCSDSGKDKRRPLEQGPLKPTMIVEVDDLVKKNPAKLVLVVVLDQLPSRAFARYAPHLSPDGIIRRAMDKGMYHPRVRYGYAGTNTAPGHASIYTGEVPADHGIDANDIYNYEAGARMRIVNDGKEAMFGVPGNFASPTRLLKPTVGDLLHKKHPDAKVISVSLKGRAAVVSGGKTPDLVTWYSPVAAAFTTSTYYADALPAWIDTWNQANPVAERFAPWTAADPELLASVNGKDDAAGEEDWHGLGTTFPHDTSKTRKPSKVFLATPQSVAYLLDMSRAIVDEFKLGEDDVPDLLSVSISSTDYAGHAFGTDSWEYLDLLIKVDKELTTFVSELEAKTDVALLITSDHGGTPLAETSLAKGEPGGRVYADELIAQLEKKADKALGKANWIKMYIQPYLYLHEDALASPKRAELHALIRAHAEATPTIEAIYPTQDARSWRGDENWLKRDVASSVAAATDALFVVPAEGHVASPGRGTLGTGHGTPWDSDREVPLMAVGKGIHKGTSSEVVGQERVAATIAAMLGLPWHLPASSLAGSPEIPKTKTTK